MTRDDALARAELVPGWMSTPELEWLYDRASECDVVLEVGVWKGRSTYALSAGCRGRVYAIDHFQGSLNETAATPEVAAAEHVEEEAYRNLEDWLTYGRLLILRLPSAEVARRWAETEREPFADMLFIDGDHTREGVTQDLELARWLKPGGLLCGHDATQQGVADAVRHLSPTHAPMTRIWWTRT